MPLSADYLYQAAAIPLKGGKVCLITSASGNRWVIPKGCQDTGNSLPDTALQEAWEEAGLTGTLDPAPVGTYLYEKWGRTCYVTVYVMRVTAEAESWPEQELRRRVWLEPARAVSRISEQGLRELIEAAVRA
jgi:8-oxo-dGTP pyrophosphatase MutT (NUDIX family)